MKDKTLNRLLLFLGFLLLLFYYGLVHPLVPFDTDDWINMTLRRPLYPSLNCWNPTKVFPERLETAAAAFAARAVAPVVGDYVKAIIMVNAIIVAGFISLYLYLIQRLLTFRFRLSQTCSFCIVVLFALMHFLLLKTRAAGNDYLWYAEDANCYYHYIVSNLLNACLVIWLMLHGARNLGIWRAVILCIVTYFALCSNLYSTVILIAYVGSSLVYDIVNCDKKESGWMGKYIRRNVYFLGVVVLWLGVQLIEVSGIRANAYGHVDDSLSEYMALSIQHFLATNYNFAIVFGAALVVICAKIHDLIAHQHKTLHIGTRQAILLLAAILSLAYLILLSAKVKPENMQKGQVIFSYAFFLLLLSALSLAYLCTKFKAVRYLLPLAIFITAFSVNSYRTAFRGVQGQFGITEYECIDHDRDIIDQVRYAHALKQDSVVIRVPHFDVKDNWPLAFDCGWAVGVTLQRHHLLNRHLKTTFALDNVNSYISVAP